MRSAKFSAYSRQQLYYGRGMGRVLGNALVGYLLLSLGIRLGWSTSVMFAKLKQQTNQSIGLTCCNEETIFCGKHETVKQLIAYQF